MRSLNNIFLIISLLMVTNAFAVPVDWKGSLNLDTNLIKDFRRTGDTCDDTKGECIKNESNNARFQSMTLRLSPEFIVNDGVTIFSELSAGSTTNPGTDRARNLGSSTTADGGAYYAQSSSSSLNVNQLYAELYADTALYRVGRFAKDYGLGAVINNGTGARDRYFSGYEGIEMQLKLGNFHLTPMWAKLHTEGAPNGDSDAYETSITAMYDNPNSKLKVGVLYGQREVETKSTLGGSTATSSQNVTLVDVYFAKAWEKFSFELEIPMMTGEVGTLYGTGDADIDTNAYILETKYQLSANWNIGIDAGIIKGDDGTSKSFEGMYLHPNYQIAEILYRYNYNGFSDTNYNVYNGSIVNSTYAKLYTHYNKGAWTWKMAAIMAKADQVAEDGKEFYNHSKGQKETAVADQESDLGYEFDLAFDYNWNPTVTLGGYLAYHVVGEYYEFSNDTETLSTSNVLASGMRLSIGF